MYNNACGAGKQTQGYIETSHQCFVPTVEGAVYIRVRCSVLSHEAVPQLCPPASRRHVLVTEATAAFPFLALHRPSCWRES